MLALSAPQLESLNEIQLNARKQQLCQQIKEDLHFIACDEVMVSFAAIFEFFWQESRRYKIITEVDLIRFLILFIPLDINYRDNPTNGWLEGILNTDVPVNERIDTIYRLIKASAV